MAQVCPTPGIGSGQNFAGQRLTNHNFSTAPAGSLKYAVFTNADLRGAMFAGQDLICADFGGANLGISEEGNPTDLSATILNGTSFAGAATHLLGTDLSFAQMTCVDFSNALLTGVRFGPTQIIPPGQNCRTLMIGTTLNAGQIQPILWSSIDFTNAVFLNPAALSLNGQSIGNAILTGVNLAGVDFTGANLTGAQLVQANLTGATFDNATLDQANLAGANLTQASFQKAHLVGASLSSPTIQAALVPGADFSDAILTSAQLDQIDFQNAILTNATFANVALQGANFGGAIMPKASFAGAKLQGIVFNNAILEGASFNGATFQTDPTNGNRPVDFACAQLGGADMSNAKLSAPQSSEIVVDFENAVMAGKADGCCQDPSQQPSGYTCGTITQTQTDYGAVTLPSRWTAPVRCPDGAVASCDAGTCSCIAWSIPNWRTSACGGGSRVVWTAPNCGSPPHGPTVQFKDAHLKACILNALSGNPTELLVTTAQQLPQVNCPGAGITDVTGLENF
jgi:uncharacterized protein YjbI with pentapeptide repeats